MARHKPTAPTPSMAERGHQAGLTTLARHGTSHMARIGAAGQDALSLRIAEAYGIPQDAPDYLVRLQAARRLYMAQVRRGLSPVLGPSRPRRRGQLRQVIP